MAERPIAERVLAEATCTDRLFVENNACDMQQHRDELLAIYAELEKIAEEMRQRCEQNRVDGGYYTLEWADRLAGRKE